MAPQAVLATVRVVGGACGPSIQICINVAMPGDEVQVPAGVYNETLSIDKAVSLVGLGATPADTVVSAAGLDDRVLLVRGASVDESVVITNLTLRDGVATGSELIFRNGGGVLVFDGARPSISHVVIRNNQSTGFSGGGLWADVGSPLTLNDVVFQDNTAILSGGGAAFEDAVNIVNSRFEGNISTNNVGGAMLTRGETYIDATTFIDNEAADSGQFGIGHGGAVYAFEVNVTVENSHFENNHCRQENCDGGAIYFIRSFETPTLTLTDTTFDDNSSSRNGGAVFANASVLVSGGGFHGNEAGGSDSPFADGGGGLYAASLAASAVEFIGNRSGKQGGGVIALSGATLVDVHFEGNQALEGGGFAGGFAVGDYVFTDVSFLNNTAEEDGGGVWIPFKAPSLERVRLEGNVASTGSGGGLWVNGDLTAVQTDLVDNVAAEDGGGAYIETGDAHLTGGLVRGNRARGSLFFFRGGGGLYVAAGDLHATGTTFESNQATDGAGGGALVAGSTTLASVRLEGNSALQVGGGVLSSGPLSIAGGSTLVDNVAGFNGGGALSGGDATVSDSSFRGNVTHASGGGLAVSCIGATVSCTALVQRSEFVGNSAAFIGGGLAGFSKVTVEDSLFQENLSEGSGGGIGAGFDSLTLVGSRFIDNHAAGSGGGSGSNGAVSAVDTVFESNHGDGNGGGLSTSGVATLLGETRFVSNTAGGHGGGVFANSGANSEGTVFQGNESGATGGGLAAPGGFVTVLATLFDGNTSVSDGGGLVAFEANLISASRFLANQSGRNGGALWYRRDATIETSEFALNEAPAGTGGAIHGESNANGDLVITTSSLHGNAAGATGGGIHLAGHSLTMENVTLSGNVGSTGGALNLEDVVTATLGNVTVVGNLAALGDALAVSGGIPAINVTNILIAGSCATGGGTVFSMSGNIESPADSCGLGVAGDQVAVPAGDLALGLLADNGGPTPTHALLAGSVAIDTGVSPCPATDQRGFGRLDGACDVGAYEAAPPTASGIDVMPGSDVNPVNSRKKGVIPVVLFGTPDLDITRVVFRSLAFGPAGAAPAHKRGDGHREDVNGDGFVDLVAHFRAPDTGLVPGDTMACLAGATVAGERIQGCDTVRVK